MPGLTANLNKYQASDSSSSSWIIDRGLRALSRYGNTFTHGPGKSQSSGHLNITRTCGHSNRGIVTFCVFAVALSRAHHRMKRWRRLSSNSARLLRVEKDIRFRKSQRISVRDVAKMAREFSGHEPTRNKSWEKDDLEFQQQSRKFGNSVNGRANVSNSTLAKNPGDARSGASPAGNKVHSCNRGCLWINSWQRSRLL